MTAMYTSIGARINQALTPCMNVGAYSASRPTTNYCLRWLAKEKVPRSPELQTDHYFDGYRIELIEAG